MSITLNGTTGITSPAITSDVTGAINGFTPQASNMQPFNRIINGAMTVDQRNAGASYSQINGGYSLDRWNGTSFTGGVTTGKYTVQQNAGSVTPPVGFTKYLGVTSSTALASNAGDIYTIGQPIEGFNLADLAWGTANAKPVTLSFWVRSSATGTFGGSFRNNTSGNYNYIFSYIINSANTWEYKTIYTSGATSGAWPTGNTGPLQIMFQLQVGSTYTDTAGTWSTTAYGATGCVDLLNTSGATFYITGVQLEVGSTASPFAHENVGDTLRKCQRYYWQLPPSSSYASNMPMISAGQAWSSTNAANFTATFPVTMRASPTLFQSGLRIYSPNIGARTGSITLQNSNAPHGSNLQISGVSSLSGGQMWYIVGSGNATDYIGFGAEL